VSLRLPPLSDLPADHGGPVFSAPWEAQAFALVLSLYDKGLFTWPEWAAALAGEIKRAQAAGDPDTGETYYRHWLGALEKMLTEKGLTTPERLASYRRAWHNAAARTPHGTAIALREDDFPS
jgi:nitrile hydratase accessory protein